MLVVSPPFPGPIQNQYGTLSGNTSGASTLSGTNIVFVGGSNVTLQGSSDSLYFHAAAGGTGGGGGSTYTFLNSNGVTFGQAGASVTASVRTDYAASTHTHSQYQSTGAYLTTAQPVGAYLTTAALSQDSSKYAGTVTGITGSIGLTANTSGVSVSIPAFLTTAQPVGAYLTTARASNDGIGLNTAGTAVTWTVNSAGISLNAGGYLTTAMASNAGTGFMSTSERGNYFATSNNTLANSTHSHGNPTLALTNASGTTASASNGLTLSLSVGNYLTTAAQSGHSHGNPTLALTNLSGTTASASNGLTLSLSAAAPGAAGAVSFSAGAASAALGSVVFSNLNGVSFGLNGSTITASVNAGGGAAPERRYIQIIEGERFTTAAALSATQYTNRPFVQPFWMDGTGIQANTVRMMVSVAGSSNRSFGGTFQIGIYSQNNSTQLTRLATDVCSYSITASSLSSIYNGAMMMDFTGMSGYTATAEGRYALVFLNSPVSANATWMAASVYGADPVPSIARILSNNTTVATGNTGASAFLPFWGMYSTTTGGLPAAIGLSEVYGGNSASLVDLYAIIKEI